MCYVGQDILQLDHLSYVAMGITNPVVDEVYGIAHNLGFKCKAYGPGIGGCLVVHLPDNTQEQNLRALKAQLKKKGYNFIETQMNVRGLDLVNKNDSDKSL